MGCLALVIGACSAAPVDAQVTQVAFVPGSTSNSVASTQVPTMAAGTHIAAAGSNPRSVAVSPDGRRLYVATSSSLGVKVYDAADSSYFTTISGTGGSLGLAITPDAAGST